MRARHAARGRARGVVAGAAAVVWWLVSGSWTQGVGESVEEGPRIVEEAAGTVEEGLRSVEEGDVYVEDGYLTWGECEWS